MRLLWIGAIELLVGLVATLAFHDPLAAWQATARYSARVSLTIFALIIVADAYPSSRSARILGDHGYALFAFNHLIHLGFLTTYVVRSEHYPPLTRLSGGALGYLLIVAMPWLQGRAEGGLMTARSWRRWQLGYQLYVGFIFVMTYVPRVFGDSSRFGGERPHFLILFVFVVALGIWRVAVALLTARGILRRHDDPV